MGLIKFRNHVRWRCAFFVCLDLGYLDLKYRTVGISKVYIPTIPMVLRSRHTILIAGGLHRYVCLLLQDIEQLLDAHGLAVVGPRQILQNLYKLLAAAVSVLPQSMQQRRPPI